MIFPCSKSETTAFTGPLYRSLVVVLVCAILASGIALTGCVVPGVERTMASQADEEFDGFVEVTSGIDEFRFPTPRKSLKGLRTENVMLQQFDYSCGTGALATVFKYFLGMPVDEATLLTRYFNYVRASGNGEEKIKVIVEEGLSLADLFFIATQLPYTKDGEPVQIHGRVAPYPLEVMEKINAPAIVRIEKLGYQHFVVFRGVSGDRVYLADPSRGNIRLTKKEFLKQWSGESLYFGFADWTPERYPLDVKDKPAYPIELRSARRAILDF